MTVIDTHGHVIPPDLVAAMRQGTAPDGIRIEEDSRTPTIVHRQGYRYPLVREFFDVHARLESMDATGTDISLLSVAPPLFLYWMATDNAPAAAQMINDAVAAMVDQGRGRFFGLANLPMQTPSRAADELRRAVTTLGMRGAQIGPHVEGVPLDDPSLRPVLHAAVELDVPLVLHPYYVGSSPDLGDYYLTNLQGNPWQTAVAASRLIFSGILDELPGLQVVLVHGGGHLPFQIGRLDHGHRVRPEAQAPRQPPSQYLRRFHYDTLTHSRESTDWLIERVGADRVMFGTDIPFDMGGGTFAEQVPDAANRTAVSSGNARRLFNLNGGPR